MPVVLIEGFDANLPAVKGWATEVVSGPAQSGSFQQVTPRAGSGKAFWLATTSGSNNWSENRVRKVLPSTYSSLIIGVALNPNVPTGSQGSAADHGSNRAIFGFATAAGTEIASLRLGVGEIPYISGGAGKGLDTAGFTHPVGAWHYYEMKIVINGASGSCQLKIDGVQVIAPFTLNLGTTNIGSVFLQGFVINTGQTQGNVFDDIYVVDTSSTPNNDFIGDCRVETIVPTAAGNSTVFTPSAGANYAAVDDLTVNDGDTTTVSSSTVGDLDLYTVTDLSPAAARILAVQSCITAKKSDAGTRSVAPAIRQGGTTYIGTDKALAQTYGVIEQIWNQDPTAVDWTLANINADEFGMKTTV